MHRAAEAIEAGRAAARHALPNLLDAIEAARSEAPRWWNVRTVTGDRDAA